MSCWGSLLPVEVFVSQPLQSALEDSEMVAEAAKPKGVGPLGVMT